MATVIVCGSASATVSPDRAEVTLALAQVAADAPSALAEVGRRSQLLEALLADHGLARDDWATEGVTVGEEREWRNDSNVLVGYRAQTALTVTVRSVELVSAVVGDGVAKAGAEVRNLAWRVDSDNSARRTLLGEAARDARARAEAYAAALGLRLGEVELISELPVDSRPGPLPRPMMEMAMAKRADQADVAVSAGRVELTAEVHVRFAMLPQ